MIGEKFSQNRIVVGRCERNSFIDDHSFNTAVQDCPEHCVLEIPGEHRLIDKLVLWTAQLAQFLRQFGPRRRLSGTHHQNLEIRAILGSFTRPGQPVGEGQGLLLVLPARSIGAVGMCKQGCADLLCHPYGTNRITGSGALLERLQQCRARKCKKILPLPQFRKGRREDSPTPFRLFLRLVSRGFPCACCLQERAPAIQSRLRHGKKTVQLNALYFRCAAHDCSPVSISKNPVLPNVQLGAVSGGVNRFAGLRPGYLVRSPSGFSKPPFSTSAHYTREASPRFTLYRFKRTRRNTFRVFRAELRTVREDQKLAKLTGNLSDRPH